MSKAVLISIKPKWCEKIAKGEKTIEVRKTRPKLKPPFKCYIYCSEGNELLILKKTQNINLNRKVIGEFECNCISMLRATNIIQCYYNHNSIATCLTDKELLDYANGKNELYYWNISNLKIYDNPKELSEFQIIDAQKNKSCQYRKRTYQNPDYTNGAFIYGSYYCKKKDDWCCNCNKKTMKRPPQSWCYVDELEV